MITVTICPYTIQTKQSLSETSKVGKDAIKGIYSRGKKEENAILLG